MVYDPVSTREGMPATIHLLKDDIEVSEVEINYSDSNWLVWDISNVYTVTNPDAVNEITRNIFSIVCGGKKVNLGIDVTTEGSRKLGLTSPSSLILNLSTAGRSSNEIRRNRTVFKSSVNTNTITTSLNHFNWQNNGWRDSDGVNAKGVDSGAYLNIANDAELSVSLPGSGLVLNSSKNYTFEFRFRVKNVQKYSTLAKLIPKYFYDKPLLDNEGNI